LFKLPLELARRPGILGLASSKGGVTAVVISASSAFSCLVGELFLAEGITPSVRAAYERKDSKQFARACSTSTEGAHLKKF
jgi:hypothetical protein